jgi:hypothetical protein
VDEFSKPYGTRSAPVDSTAARDPVVGGDEAAEAVSEAELREFLAVDPLSPPADPVFKRRLQARLWDIVQTRLKKSRRDEPLQGWRRREVPPDPDPDSSRDSVADTKRERGPA